MLDSVRESLTTIAQLGRFERDEVIVTAGGSLYFDRVIDALRDWPQVSQLPVKSRAKERVLRLA